MATLAGALKQLRQERDQAAREVERLTKAIHILGTLVGRNTAGRTTRKGRTKRTMPAAARRRIAAAQRARWAKWRAQRRKRAA